MIEPDHPLPSIGQQCKPLPIARSSLPELFVKAGARRDGMRTGSVV